MLTAFTLLFFAPTVALITGILLILYKWFEVLILRGRLPPGPFPLPLFGNVFQLPKEKQWCRLEDWSKAYNSPVITFWEGSQPQIVCNDAWSISELCDRRANIYSSRPFRTVTGKLFGLYETNQAGMPYADKWRLHRRVTVNKSLKRKLRLTADEAS